MRSSLLLILHTVYTLTTMEFIVIFCQLVRNRFLSTICRFIMYVKKYRIVDRVNEYSFDRHVCVTTDM